MTRICLTPRPASGGPASFQARLAEGLARRGVQVCYDPDEACDAVLIIGGTRRLDALWRARRRGVRLVQRLNGMNWLHRLRRTGLRHYLRAEYGNWLLAFIRARLADGVVYQSEFSRQWWERRRGPTPVPSRVVHNGVDLTVFTPQGPERPPADRFRLLLVEGNLGGGYETGLEIALRLAGLLAERLPVEWMVAGRLAADLQAQIQARSPVPLVWAGKVPTAQIPALDRSAHLLYSADIHPACPNAVIEALACGLPVLAFETGALPELVTGDAGRLVPYGGDPWKLDPPDVPALAAAAAEMLADLPRFRRAARTRAEAAFGLDNMVEAYLQALLA
jgi:glycosyltransferase involved in cell wall biosynthesis